MSIDKWSIVDMSDINRISGMNIYTILECEESEEESEKEESEKEESEKADQEYCNVEMVDIDYGEFMIYKNSNENLGNQRKIEKKNDVYKIMKDYVKKHRKKY